MYAVTAIKGYMVLSILHAPFTKILLIAAGMMIPISKPKICAAYVGVVNLVMV